VNYEIWDTSSSTFCECDPSKRSLSWGFWQPLGDTAVISSIFAKQPFSLRHEFAYVGNPFYLRADEILELQGHQRIAENLDNQFRLMREDMLPELRETVQIAQGQKKGRWPTLRLKILPWIQSTAELQAKDTYTHVQLG
jgi:hypothetical protein